MENSPSSQWLGSAAAMAQPKLSEEGRELVSLP